MYFDTILFLYLLLPFLNSVSFRFPYFRDPPSPIQKINPFSSLNGFYGLIGGEKGHKISLSGDGIIQGVFIENGKVCKTVRNKVLTDRVDFIKKYPFMEKYINSNLFLVLISIGKFLNVVDKEINFEGRANTGLFLWEENNVILALHERDRPYVIQIDFNNKIILNLGKITNYNKNVHSVVSAHPSYHKMKKQIISVEYDLFGDSTISIYNSTDFSPIMRECIQTKYMSIIHDFISSYDNIYIPDCPLEFDLYKLVHTDSAIPMSFFKNKPSRIGIWNKNTQKTDWITFPSSFFLFHFVNVYEFNNNITYIDVCLFNDIDMENLNRNLPKLCRLIIDKNKNYGRIEYPNELSNIYTDFPTQLPDYNVCLLKLDVNSDKSQIRSRGFVIVDNNLKLHTNFTLPGIDSYFCGQLSFCEKTNSILGFCVISGESNLFLYDIQNGFHEFQKLENYTLENGFHSIFYNKN